MPENQAPELHLSEHELSSIEAFRKKTETAVLTIMFTDIEGFTALTEAKGEKYVHQLHEEHDRLLSQAIEEDGAGLVIKFIGDSVMAVFAEPTAAVDRALRIQRRLNDYNRDHPELDDLKVRIGLHLGQTVVENRVQTDLFGRHVNKASRVESLAAGGHIYLSYPVFDSVKSWVLDAPQIEFVHHGPYFLKGIPQAEHIYEVYQTGVARPQAPRKAKKQWAFTPLLAGLLGLLVLVVVGYMIVPSLLRPTVFFKGMIASDPILDLTTPLAAKGVPGSDDLTTPIVPIPAGHHVIGYEVSTMSHYYAEFDVKSGKNVVVLQFHDSELPGVVLNYYWGPSSSPNPPLSRTNEGHYVVYPPQTFHGKAHDTQVFAEVTGLNKTADKAIFHVHVSITIDGTNAGDQQFDVTNPLHQTEFVDGPTKVIYKDGAHQYEVRTSCFNDSIQVNVDGEFVH